MKNLGSTLLIGIVTFAVAFGGMKFFRGKGRKPASTEVAATNTSVPASPISLTEAVLFKTSGDYTLKVGFDLKKGCYLGDLDAIEMDLSHSSSERVILTLESLEGDAKKFPPQVHALSRAVLSAGLVAAEFSIPAKLEPLNLAVFICKDTANKNSCGSKAFSRPDEVVVKNSAESLRGKYSAPDRFYFAQYLLWSGDGRVRYFKNIADNSKVILEASRALSSTSTKKTDVGAKFAAVSMRLGSFMPVLKSYPFEVNAGKFKFTLTKYDRSLCR
jgi:hypothetical protein